VLRSTRRRVRRASNECDRTATGQPARLGQTMRGETENAKICSYFVGAGWAPGRGSICPSPNVQGVRRAACCVHEELRRSSLQDRVSDVPEVLQKVNAKISPLSARPTASADFPRRQRRHRGQPSSAPASGGRAGPQTEPRQRWLLVPGAHRHARQSHGG
jgi:hypothetical protein